MNNKEIKKYKEMRHLCMKKAQEEYLEIFSNLSTPNAPLFYRPHALIPDKFLNIVKEIYLSVKNFNSENYDSKERNKKANVSKEEWSFFQKLETAVRSFALPVITPEDFILFYLKRMKSLSRDEQEITSWRKLKQACLNSYRAINIPWMNAVHFSDEDNSAAQGTGAILCSQQPRKTAEASFRQIQTIESLIEVCAHLLGEDFSFNHEKLLQQFKETIIPILESCPKKLSDRAVDFINKLCKLFNIEFHFRTKREEYLSFFKRMVGVTDHTETGRNLRCPIAVNDRPCELASLEKETCSPTEEGSEELLCVL